MYWGRQRKKPTLTGSGVHFIEQVPKPQRPPTSLTQHKLQMEELFTGWFFSVSNYFRPGFEAGFHSPSTAASFTVPQWWHPSSHLVRTCPLAKWSESGDPLTGQEPPVGERLHRKKWYSGCILPKPMKNRGLTSHPPWNPRIILCNIWKTLWVELSVAVTPLAHNPACMWVQKMALFDWQGTVGISFKPLKFVWHGGEKAHWSIIFKFTQ